MPIIGKVNGMPYEHRIENMIVGSNGYIHADQITVTKEAVLIDIISSVIPSNEMDGIVPEFIPIKRIGSGLTELDFELDFTNSDYSDMIIEPHGVYLDLIKEKEKFLIFTTFDLVVHDMKEEVLSPEDMLELLDIQLQEALANQEFEIATKLRDQIAKLNQKPNE